MPPSDIASLGPLSTRYWPDRAPPCAKVKGKKDKGRFETIREKRLEDKNRVKWLKYAIRKFPNCINVEAARDLATRLQKGVDTGNPPDTLASGLRMRAHRHRVIGHMWKLAVEVHPLQVAVATLMPKGHLIKGKGLANFVPKKRLKALKTDCYRCGAKAAKGCLIIGIHGQFNCLTDMFQIHFHIMAVGGMIEVLDRLRKLKKYRNPTVPIGSGIKRPPHRVRITRKPITDLSYALSYVVQSFWPHRPEGESGAVTVKRGRRRRRIPEPYHTHWMLRMDRWSLADMTLLLGVRVTKSGFEITKR